MSFTNKVDYLPKIPGGSEGVDLAERVAVKRQQQRWQIFFGSFLLLVVLSNIYIWSRPAIFKSEAFMHFSNSPQNNQQTIDVMEQHIALNMQRLKSNSTLEAVSEALQKQQINLSTEQLEQMMQAKVSNVGRLIILEAVGHDPQLLKPILDNWLAYYLALIDTENVSNNSADNQQYSQQIAFFEQKITQQQGQLDNFSQSHNIISLDRDENRVLNKIKGLGASLDIAEAEDAEALALLESINISIEKGQLIERAADKAAIDGNRQNLQTLTAELSALSDQYTQVYLQRDPVVVAKQQQAKTLADTIEQQIIQSQNLYLQDAQRNVAVTAGKRSALRKQLDDLQLQAINFNQKMEQYRRSDEALKELQQQAQTLKNQWLEQEVSKPFTGKIKVLEKPFTPAFPIAPDYWQDTLISLPGALLAAVLVLLLFSFIVRQKIAPGTTRNFVVIPAQQYIDQHGKPLVNQSAALGQASQTLRLSKSNGHTDNVRLLSTDDCQNLYHVANHQGKLVIGLLLSGVNVDELSNISKDDFSGEYSCLNINARGARKVTLHQSLQALVASLYTDQPGTDLLWSTPLSEDDFTQLIINAAHDGELIFPEQLSVCVLRHTYLTFLVSQGARLNDLELFAGYIIPTELALYRQVNRHGKALEPEAVNAIFPFQADAA
ncbi:MAG: succinoglycan biosynthesis transport protein ExoP [Paraglaciecola sp.]|jgi:succinoglycan biosynthesis transport protein ExoP